MTRIFVPTISEGLTSYDRLFDMWRQVNTARNRVTFDFSGCTFLGQSGVAFLGGLARLIERRGGEVSFDWDTLRSNVRMNLAQNGFLSAFQGGVGPWEGNSIPYREDPQLDKDALVDYLADRWLGRDWVHVSDGLRNALAARVCEIYVNAFEHSESRVGVFSCGQHYPNLRMVRLTAVDFGVGIPGNVRNFAGDETIHAGSAMKWAFRRGTTTRPGSAGGGIGLDLLKELVRVNGGALSVFSHEGYAVLLSQSERYQARPHYFEGTMVTITLRCDEKYYRLMHERDNKPLF
ncbi:MAG TPA: hypothetical protein VI750_01755 [Pyrinomonadaceae bacterium]|nr:hypothetical protein [Pyrinomonadaceae bacterium]